MVQSKSSSICDSLALTRTVLANERTFLAYIRTGITLIIAGASALQFIQDGLFITISGWTLILIGALFFILGTIRYHCLSNRLLKNS